MLKFRNISLLRRIYVWGLAFITRVAYGPDLRAATSPEAAGGAPDARRIRRINSELEFGPGAWQKEFLDSAGRASPDARDDAFQLEDVASFVSDGVEAIVGDTLSACFTADPPDPWNFLTRNIPPGKWQMSSYNTLLWLIGMWARYCVFLPFRCTCVVLGVITFSIGWSLAYLLPPSERKRAILQWLLRYLASVVVASWSGYVKFHGKRPERRPNQIYVANHTSLIDLFILHKDYNFSCIGQRHGGLAGLLQDLLMAAQDHVWFDREASSDRRVVQRLLREHVGDGSKEPMLVFPEGTCTNSEYCVMFKKGSFELGAEVHPIAMRYRRHFGDPFWNSQTTSFPRHLVDLMTSWAVVCDVYYMEPQKIRDGESAVEFANRVKRLICERAGLTSVNWDGFLKRHRISPKFLDARQRALASVITRRLNGELPRAVSSSTFAGIDGGLAQTPVTGQGGMDTLGFDKPVRRPGRGRSSSSLYREVLSLRRRRSGGPGASGYAGGSADAAQVGAGAGAGAGQERARGWRKVRELAAVQLMAGAVRNTFRWMLAFGLLGIAGMVTNKFMPASWKQALQYGFL